MFRDHIKNIFPPLQKLFELDGLILVGGEISPWQEICKKTNIEDVHYFNYNGNETNSLPYEWHNYEQILAKKDGSITYYELSNTQLNGTIPSEKLKTLWKNLYTVKTTQIKGISLESFIADIPLVNRALVINSFDAIDILQSNFFAQVVIARTIDNDEPLLSPYSKKSLDEKMSQKGYKLIASLEDNHPDISTTIYVVDHTKKINELQEINFSLTTENKMKLEHERKTRDTVLKLQQELEEKEKLNTVNQEKLKKQLQEQKNTLETKIKESQEKEKLHHKEIEVLKAQNEQLNQNLSKEKEALTLQITQKENEKLKLQQEFEEKTKINSVSLEKAVNNLQNVQKELETKSSLTHIQGDIKNHINKVSSNIIKQLESYISLKHYIDIPLDYHNWPISSDIALFMAKEIEMNSYDLILEFGSGTSTVLFANMVKQNNAKSTDIISFEHDIKYKNKTKEILHLHNLHKYAKIKFSPLEKFNYQEKEFYYYKCRNTFEKLHKKAKYNKIFVLVDGPPGSTSKMARLPAILYLLEYFPDKEIHIAVDDFSRQDEKETLLEWERILNNIQTIYTKEIINTEKGLCYLKINSTGKK